jgi:hypothetical protein
MTDKLSLADLLKSDPATISDAALDPWIGDPAPGAARANAFAVAYDADPSRTRHVANAGMTEFSQRGRDIRAFEDNPRPNVIRHEHYAIAGRARLRLELQAYQHYNAITAAVKASAPGALLYAEMPKAIPIPQAPLMPPPPPPRFDFAGWVKEREDKLTDTRFLRVQRAQDGQLKLHARGFTPDEVNVLSEYHAAILAWLESQFTIVRHHSLDSVI